MLLLAAMGSFDVEADDTPKYRTNVPEDPVFSEIQESRAYDNRYAWRLNCEDGNIYGVFPDDYETRDDYNEVLARMKYAHSDDDTIKVGDMVTVPTESGDADGIVIAVEHYSVEKVPTYVDETQWVLRK